MENTTQTPAGDKEQPEAIKIFDTKKALDVSCSVIDGSKFENICMDGTSFFDISAKKMKIVNANLSDLEIEDAQLGGAFIHNIGVPPKGHPMYNPNLKQRPLRFDDCQLSGSTFTNCNMSDITISDCNTSGMTIEGVAVQDLLEAYRKTHD
jgi:uncharacterized protein YjbI with pentapeptide repeats